MLNNGYNKMDHVNLSLKTQYKKLKMELKNKYYLKKIRF